MKNKTILLINIIILVLCADFISYIYVVVFLITNIKINIIKKKKIISITKVDHLLNGIK